MFDKL